MKFNEKRNKIEKRFEIAGVIDRVKPLVYWYNSELIIKRITFIYGTRTELEKRKEIRAVIYAKEAEAEK